MRLLPLLALLPGLGIATPAAAYDGPLIDSPSLAARVEAGELPALRERIRRITE